jgi:HK97 gp10 family phage protein
MISFQVIGAKEIAGKFATAAKVAPAVGVPAGLNTAALLVLRRAKQKAPVDTGHMEAAISKSEATPAGVDVTSHADYSVYVEYGTGIYAEGGGGRKDPWVYFNERFGHFVKTSGSPAQPFMRPALDESKEQIEALLGKAVITSFEGVMHA